MSAGGGVVVIVVAVVVVVCDLRREEDEELRFLRSGGEGVEVGEGVEERETIAAVVEASCCLSVSFSSTSFFVSLICTSVLAQPLLSLSVFGGVESCMLCNKVRRVSGHFPERERRQRS